jgi:hypothetical protein
MARRRIFHSFRHSSDWWRVQTLRQIGAIEGQPLLSPNTWEKVQRRGDRAIRAWIDEQMRGRSCVVVFIGRATHGRKWVNYEMKKGWDDGKGVVGIHIHRLKNSQGRQSTKGANPLASVTIETKNGPKLLSRVAKTYNPPYASSSSAYNHIKNNIEAWIEEAITIRKAN